VPVYASAFAGTKLYCLATEARGFEQLAQGSRLLLDSAVAKALTRDHSYLACSANLPEGLYILLALISSFFNLSHIISRSTGPGYTLGFATHF